MSEFDPDTSLLTYMGRFDLNPSRIVWDEEFHRFDSPKGKRKNKAAWYKGFPGGPGRPYRAVFGDHKRGISESWFQNRNGDGHEFDPELYNQMREEQQEEQEAAWLEVAEACQARWDKADRIVDLSHPYLKKKDVTVPTGIRQEGDLLLIPMKGVEEGNPIMSLQEIHPDGTKRFATGSRTKNCRTSISAGAFDPKGTLYITEGWATGWTINYVTKQAVVVAFSAYNLPHIAKAMREKYPEAYIIIASDNDRWSQTQRGPNPGLLAAQEAARLAEAELAVPDFQDLSTRPTDYNDLYILEGRDAVGIWLDPDRAAKAVTVVEEESVPDSTPPEMVGEWGSEIEPTTEAEEAEEEKPVWIQQDRFRVLGYNRELYYYMSQEKGQITPLTMSQHDKKYLMTLAPLSWWETHFSARKGVDWIAVVDALYRVAHRKGVFSPERVRGVGLWPIEDAEGNVTYVLHLGDRLLPPGGTRYISPESYECTEGRIYERLPRVEGPSRRRALNLTEARQLYSVFDDLLWMTDGLGALLAGWTVLAPFGGVLSWRPHIWISGGVGAGKTTVIKQIVRPLLSDMGHYFEGGTTEAGIRQTLGSDSLPIIYDEAEKKDARTDTRLQHILLLARSASSTSEHAKTAKGTTAGKAMAFHIRSMFCLASVGAALKDEADRSRVSILPLKSTANMEKGEKEAHWRRFRPRLKAVNAVMGRELMSRTMQWVRDGRLDRTIDVFREASTDTFNDPRIGDQYGTLYAGAWTLLHDDVPSAMEAREMVGSNELVTNYQDPRDDSLKAASIILQQEVRVDTSHGTRQVAVGQLVDISCGTTHGTITLEEADARLKSLGMKVAIENGSNILYFANTSEWLVKVLENTHYATVSSAFQTLRGARKTKAVRFHQGLVSRCTAVPVSVIDAM